MKSAQFARRWTGTRISPACKKTFIVALAPVSGPGIGQLGATQPSTRRHEPAGYFWALRSRYAKQIRDIANYERKPLKIDSQRKAVALPISEKPMHDFKPGDIRAAKPGGGTEIEVSK
jgi:hypothetical protein